MKSNCPDDDILAAFSEDRLPADAHERVLGHLTVCDDCLHLMGDLSRTASIDIDARAPEGVTTNAFHALRIQGILPDAGPADLSPKSNPASAPTTGGALTGQAIRRYANRFFHGISQRLSDIVFAPEPDPLAIRGEAAAVNRTVSVHRRIGNLSLLIDLEETGPDTACLRLIPDNTEFDRSQKADALLPDESSTDTARTLARTPIRATLLRKGRETASRMMMPEGTVFSPVAFGRYRLLLTSEGRELGSWAFHLTGDHLADDRLTDPMEDDAGNRNSGDAG